MGALVSQRLRDSCKVAEQCPNQTFIALDLPDIRLVGIYWPPSLTKEEVEEAMEKMKELATSA
jgi:hypothetical protein